MSVKINKANYFIHLKLRMYKNQKFEKFKLK